MHGLEGANARRLEIQQLKTIAPMPLVAKHVRQALAADTLNHQKLASILKQDPGMAARILGLANGAFFGTAGRIKTIEDSIQRVLGLNASKALVLSMVASDSFDITECRNFRLDHFWGSAMMTGALASKLIKHVEIDPQPSARLAFLCGLLHNLGLLALVTTYPAEMAHVLANLQPDQSLAEAEWALLGTDHHRAGGWLARKWRLPPEIVDVIEHHHERDRLHYWDLTRLVGFCARWSERWLGGNKGPPDEPEIMEALSLTAAALEDTFSRCEAVFRQIDRFAGRIDK
jgi:HD-like signal output (HDOD) protein